MARPRSLLGLVACLVVLHVRRRRVLALVGVLALALTLVRIAPRDRATSRRAATMTTTMQLAVLHDGFAQHEAPAWQPSVRVLARNGTVRIWEDMPVGSPFYSAVVGTSAGPALVWWEDWNVKLAAIDEDGELGMPSTWGAKVSRLCDGIGSTDRHYAIGWLDPQALWLLHGSVQPGQQAPSAVRVRTGDIGWCGVTATEDFFVVFWRAEREFFASRCSSTCSEPVRIPIETDRNGFLGFGCALDGCAIAFVDRDTYAKLGWFSIAGEVVWTKPMGGTGFRQVSIANAGPRAVVASYGAPTATIFRITQERATAVWNDPDRPFAPAVIWADDTLLLSHRSADLDDVTFEVMPLPR